MAAAYLRYQGGATHALRVIEAQKRADMLLQRVRSGEMDAEAFAVAIAPLHGLELQALARAVVKAIAAPAG